MEGVLAAFAQFDNDVRSDRTRAGIKAALELGRWEFLAPIGSLNASRSMGKSLPQSRPHPGTIERPENQPGTGTGTQQYQSSEELPQIEAAAIREVGSCQGTR